MDAGTQEQTLQVVDIKEGTSVDGPGLRTSIYFAGCRHRCPGCHNPTTWPFDAGTPHTVGELMEIIRYNRFNVTFSGGDPVYQAPALLPLARAIKQNGLTLWCYTGFTFEQIIAGEASSQAIELLGYTDVLVDGPFIESLRDISLHFRGSSNQRLIDVPQSLRQGTPVCIC